jgi:hypothetical protein
MANYKHGHYTSEAVIQRAIARQALREAAEFMASLD